MSSVQNQLTLLSRETGGSPDARHVQGAMLVSKLRKSLIIRPPASMRSELRIRRADQIQGNRDAFVAVPLDLGIDEMVCFGLVLVSSGVLKKVMDFDHCALPTEPRPPLRRS